MYFKSECDTKKNFIREISFQELINRRSHLAEVVNPWSSGFKYQSSNPTWPFSYRIIKLGEFLVGNLRCNDWKGTIFSVEQFYRARLAWLYENVLPNGIQSKIIHLCHSKRLNFVEQDSNWNFFNEPGKILSDHQTKTNLEWKLLKRVFRNLQQRRLPLISTSLIQISMKKNLILWRRTKKWNSTWSYFFLFLSFLVFFLQQRAKERNKQVFFCINGCETFLWCETRMTSSVAAAAVLLVQSDSASFLLLVLVFLSSAHNWESHLKRLDSFFPPVSRELATGTWQLTTDTSKHDRCH